MGAAVAVAATVLAFTATPARADASYGWNTWLEYVFQSDESIILRLAGSTWQASGVGSSANASDPNNVGWKRNGYYIEAWTNHYRWNGSSYVLCSTTGTAVGTDGIVGTDYANCANYNGPGGPLDGNRMRTHLRPYYFGSPADHDTPYLTQ